MSHASDAHRAYNLALDATWDTVKDGAPDVADGERVVCFRAKGPAEARIPTAFAEVAVEKAGLSMQPDGFFHFEVLPVFRNTALRLRAVPMEFWTQTYKAEPGIETPEVEPGERKLVTRSLDAVRPTSRIYGFVHVYFMAGAVELVCWMSAKGDIFIRRRFTAESWAGVDRDTKRLLLSDAPAYLGLA